MKKIMFVVAACAAAVFGTARADGENWFNGGIGAGWPDDTKMFGGAWCDDAQARGQMADGVLQVSADEEEPLSFLATYPKSLGHELAADYVYVEAQTSFSPFSVQALPSVPSDARGAVILVTTEEDPDEAAGGTLYYAAWDAAAQQNAWMPLAGAEVTTGDVCSVAMKISRGATAGFVSVDYLVSGWTAKSVTLRQPDATSNGMYFTGSGRVSSLTAYYQPGASKTVNVRPVTGLSVTNVTAGGVSVATGYGSCEVPYGSEVVVYYAAAPGYAMKGDGVVNIGTVTKDTTVDADTPGVPEAELLGKYLVGSAAYADFPSLNAALKDGDKVVMIADDTLAADATLTNAVSFDVGGRMLATADGVALTVAADVAFSADSAANLPLSLYVLADRTVTLPSGTEPSDYALDGEDYARAAFGGSAWVCLGGEWFEAGDVTMEFYFPFWMETPEDPSSAHYGSCSGPLGTFWTEDRAAILEMAADEENQAYNYFFDGTWVDAYGVPAAFPERYVPGEFFPHSTAVTFRISYEYKCGTEDVPGATNPNPAGFTIETEAFALQAAGAPGYAFTGWTDADGNEVTEVDPAAMAEALGGMLEDITLVAQFEEGGEPTVYYVTYDVTSVPGATNALANITSYTAETPAFTLLPAGAKGYDFGCWTNAAGEAVTAIAGGETGDVALYAVFALTPVKPGEPAAYDTPEQAAAAAAAFNADKAAGITVPQGFTGDKAAYAEHFEAVASGTSVTVALTADAEAALQTGVDEAVVSSGTASALTDPSASAVTVATEPGFYYSVVGGAEPDDIKTEGVRKLAQEDSVDLAKPALDSPGKSFYRIKAAVK